MNTVEDAALAVAKQAMLAHCQGTFCVGGMLLKTDGTILNQLHNNVVVDNATNDPTAHGERQLIDWYFENKDTLSLPEPNEIILVTSLDPCAMCTGASLLAGFKRVVVAANDTFAGINYDLTATYPTLSGTAMESQIESMFAYPQVLGDTCFIREASGADLDIAPFTAVTIPDTTQALCSSVFDATLTSVQNTVGNDYDPSELIDLKTLADDDPINVFLRSKFGANYLAYSGPAGNPGIDFANIVYGGTPVFQGISFFDFFGNLIFTQEANVISTQSAFMLATRLYAQVRHEGLSGVDIRKYLCHPKYGYFMYTFCPQVSAQSLMEMGAFGSTTEGSAPNPLQYILNPERQPALDSLISNMPPLYTQSVNVRVAQAADSAMVAQVDSLVNGV